MATHSNVLAWRIPATGEPGGLPSMGSHRVGYNWSDLAAAAVYFLLPFFFLTERIEWKQSMHILYSVTNVFQLLNSFLCCLGHNVEEILLGLLKSVFSYHVTSNFTKYTSVSLNFIEFYGFVFFFNSRLCYFLIYLFYLRTSTNLKKKR